MYSKGSIEVHQVIEAIKVKTAFWISVSRAKCGFSIRYVQDWSAVVVMQQHSLKPQVDWTLPSYSQLKLNFDGSSMRDCNEDGFNGVSRDFLGGYLLSCAGHLLACSANEAKLHGQWRGVEELEKLSLQGGCLEGDSKVVMGWAKGGFLPLKCRGLLFRWQMRKQ